MRPLNRAGSFVALAVLVVTVAACSAGGTTPGGGSGAGVGSSPTPVKVGGKLPFVPRIISSESIVGRNRFVFGILDETGTKTIGGPNLKVGVVFTPAASASPATGASPGESPVPTPATFIWAIPDERGVYTVDVDFPVAGDWTFETSAHGTGMDGAPVEGTVATSMQVTPTGYAIPLGGKAPSTKTPTLADVGGDPRKLSTDQHPDPAFYTTSVDQALARHEPFVLVFATPAFCRTAQCGPTLDGVKAVANEVPGMTFINVEPYVLKYADGRLQPVLSETNQLQATDTTNAWGILSEPWVFVVDRNGIVTGSFEGVVGAAELKAAISAAR